MCAAGCGSSRPALDRADADGLRSLARRIAAEGACAQARDIPRLQAQAIALVNHGRVPAPLQEPLLSGVAALRDEAPLCLPAVSRAQPTPTPRPHERHGKHRDHGKGKGHGGEGGD